MFIPVTLLGNDPDPIVHWYFTSSPVAEHVNVAVCVRSALCGDGGVVNVGAVTTYKWETDCTNVKRIKHGTCSMHVESLHATLVCCIQGK